VLTHTHTHTQIHTGTKLDDELTPDDVDVFKQLRELCVTRLPGRKNDKKRGHALKLRTTTQQVFNQAVISDSVQTFEDITDWNHFDIFKYACSARNLFPELFFTTLGKSGMDILKYLVRVSVLFVSTQTHTHTHTHKPHLNYYCRE